VGIALVAAALLVSSVPMGDALHGTFGQGHAGISGWGLAVWRVALLLVVVTATRAALLAEADAEAAHTAARRS
jgi:hypothetical protein